MSQLTRRPIRWNQHVARESCAQEVAVSLLTLGILRVKGRTVDGKGEVRVLATQSTSRDMGPFCVF